MKKLLVIAAIIAGFVASPALAGTGDAFATKDQCVAAISTAHVYEPEVVSSRARVSQPMNGWAAAGITGKVCALEHIRTSEVSGQTGPTRTVWAWVVIPGESIVKNGNDLADLRCFNPIRELALPRARVIADCVECNQQPVAPRPAPRRGTTFVPSAPVQQVRTAAVTFQPLALPAQTIGLGGSTYVSVGIGGNSYNTTNNTHTGTAQTFTGNTQPPVNGGGTFTGNTQPFNGNGGGTLPYPVNNGGSLPAPVFNGYTSGGLPNPVFNGGGTVINNGGLPNPVFNGGGQVITNGGTFTGNTNGSTSTFVGGTNGGLPNPVYLGGGQVINNGGTFTGSTNGQ